ncbi:hypothetical protein DFQ26_001212 [Actinomortierella ambigua]|nr:hypothetical protein DFQ26_001212 [Actinomortierella ambigua]
MNVERYRKRVAELISKADLDSVSAKSIRRQIESLENVSLKDVKAKFDKMVTEEYNRITDEVEKKKQSQSAAPPMNGFGFALPPTSLKSEPAPPPPPPSTKKRSRKQSSSEDSDESDEEDGDSDGSDEYSSVDEGDSKRSKAPAAKKKKTIVSSKKKDEKSKSKKKTTGKKSADKPKKKRAPALNEDGTPKPNALTRPQIISPTLANVVGVAIGPSGQPEMSRAQVVKQLWVYIKANNLQDPQDKKSINCDAKMRAIFGMDKVGCFEMNKYIGVHLTKIENQ